MIDSEATEAAWGPWELKGAPESRAEWDTGDRGEERGWVSVCEQGQWLVVEQVLALTMERLAGHSVKDPG